MYELRMNMPRALELIFFFFPRSWSDLPDIRLIRVRHNEGKLYYDLTYLKSKVLPKLHFFISNKDCFYFQQIHQVSFKNRVVSWQRDQAAIFCQVMVIVTNNTSAQL